MAQYTVQFNYLGSSTWTITGGAPTVIPTTDEVRFRIVNNSGGTITNATINGLDSSFYDGLSSSTINLGTITDSNSAASSYYTINSAASGSDTGIYGSADSSGTSANTLINVSSDTEPDQFTCPADVTGANDNTVYYSNTGTTTNDTTLDGDQRITGIDTSVSISITGVGCTFQLWNGSAWGSSLTSGTVSNNTYFRILITSSGTAGTGVTATLSAGSPSVSDTWTVTTADDVPDAFTFTDVSNAGTSTQVASTSVALSGFTDAATASVETANSGQMSINGGAWTTTNTAVSSGDTVAVRMTTGASFNTGYDVDLTITGDTTGLTRVDTFTATTIADPGEGKVIENNFVANYSQRDIMRFFGGDDGPGLYEIRADNLRAYERGGDNVPDVTENNSVGTSAGNVSLTQFNDTETRLKFTTYPPTRQDIRFHSLTTGDQTLFVDWDANGEYAVGYSPGMWSLCDFKYSFTVDSILDPGSTGAAAGDVLLKEGTTTLNQDQWYTQKASVKLEVDIGEFEDVTYSGTFTITVRNEYDTAVSKEISATASWTMAHIDDVN